LLNLDIQVGLPMAMRKQVLIANVSPLD